MRIGMRVPGRTSGGGAAFYAKLSEAFPVSGAELLRFVSADQHDPDTDVPVELSGSAALRQLRAGRALSVATAAAPVDVMVQPGSELARSGDVPQVLWPLTVAPLERAARRAMGRTARDRLKLEAQRISIGESCRRADAFVFSSYYARSLYQDQFPSIAGKPSCVLAPAPTLTPDGTPTQASPIASDAGDRYLLFVSHLYPYKMVGELIEGFAVAAESGLDLNLKIAGRAVDKAYADELVRRVTELGLSARVEFLGNVAAHDLRSLYRDAAGFVFSSISENAGSFALIDAFMFGLPVFSSWMSSNVEAGQFAPRYFDPRDPASLAEQLMIANGSDDWSAMRDRSLIRSREFATWADLAIDLAAFCRSLKVDS